MVAVERVYETSTWHSLSINKDLKNHTWLEAAFNGKSLDLIFVLISFLTLRLFCQERLWMRNSLLLNPITPGSFILPLNYALKMNHSFFSSSHSFSTLLQAAKRNQLLCSIFCLKILQPQPHFNRKTFYFLSSTLRQATCNVCSQLLLPAGERRIL